MIDQGQAEKAMQSMSMVIWHPEIHRSLAQEQLGYVNLGFHPRYERDLALEIIDRAMASVSVRSYTLWELQRKPDILLRAWLPPTSNTVDIVTAISDEAKRHPLHRSDIIASSFTVQRTLVHHLWPHSPGAQDTEDVLNFGGDYLSSGLVTGEFDDEMKALIRQSLVTEVLANPNGLKFFIWLTLQDMASNERARPAMESELIRIVNSTPNIYATSVYFGESSFASYLVTGRFKPEHYEVLARGLQPRLANLGQPFIATNSDTALSTLFGPIKRVENLLTVGEPVKGRDLTREEQDLETLLTRDESADLEFKGSAFTPIATDGRENVSDAEIANRTKKVRDAVVKSVTGFLNTSGGTLVIGVLESDRVKAELVLATANQVGSYLVIGVDRTIDSRAQTWDQFERRLRTLLSESITPAPDPWLRIRRVTHDGMDVAVVTIDKPSSWFWAKTSVDSDIFYARYGNATQPLKGPAQLNHMKSSPREG